MNVTRANIDTATDEFTSLVSTASFIAMDLEMTGISLPGPETKEHLMDTPSMRYVKMRQVASRFSVIQVGLTLFHAKTESKTEPKTVPVPGTTSASTSPDTTDIISSSDTHTSSNVDAYDARVYNVFTFPQKGQITLDGSAVDFLVNNGMDWNAWFENGVPYLRQGPAEKLKLIMFPPPKPTSQPSNGTDTSTDTAAAPQASPTPTPIKAKRANANAMVLNKTEDINFCKDALAGVAEWAKAIENIDCNDKDNANANDTSPSPSNEHILPSCNSYRRRFLYQELERIYGNGDNNDNGNSDSSKFTVETRTPNPNRHWEKLMVILCLTPAQRAAKEHADHLEKVKQYNAKLGFRRMWTALTQSNRPLVVHNGLYDLMFMVHHMHDDLPDTLEEFKIVVGGLFPGGIYDTRMVGGKIFVKDNALEVTSRNLFSDLRLDRVYGVCKSEADAAGKDAAEKEAEAANANASTNSSTKGEEHSSTPSSSSSSSSSSSTSISTRLSVDFTNGHDRYCDPSKAILHEAGYDSYITAFSFAYMRRITEVQYYQSSPYSITHGDVATVTGAGRAMTSMVHLEGSNNYRIPLFRSFYPGVNLAPASIDVVAELEHEDQYVFSGFPKEYTTSDVMRLFNTNPTPTSGVDNEIEEAEAPSSSPPPPLPSIYVRWINDNSVVVRFAKTDAKIVLANLTAHMKIIRNASTDLKMELLDSYMRFADEKIKIAADDADNVNANDIVSAAKTGIKRKAVDFISSSTKRVRTIIQGYFSTGEE